MNEEMDRFLSKRSSREERERRFRREYDDNVIGRSDMSDREQYAALRQIQFAANCLPPGCEITASIRTSVKIALKKFLKRVPAQVAG